MDGGKHHRQQRPLNRRSDAAETLRSQQASRGQASPRYRVEEQDARHVEKTFVQSLAKGLQVLESLNLNNGAGVNQLAKLTGINRATVYRLAETLRLLGLVERDDHTGCYWLQSPVMGLAGGFQCEDWIDAKARAALDDLGRAILWPLSLMVPSGIAMVLRACTDPLSPFTIRKMPIGFRISLAGTASGRAFLAACDEGKRNQLVQVIRNGSAFADDAVAREPEAFNALIAQTIRQGYAVQDLSTITAFAVPVVRRGEPVGSLCLRYYSSAMPLETALNRYLQRLQQVAALLGGD